MSNPINKQPDILHPSKESPQCTYHEGDHLWRVDIEFVKPKLFKPIDKGAIQPDYKSLDALCEAEAKRRAPHLSGKKLQKIKRQIAHSACNRKNYISKPMLSDGLKKHLNIASSRDEEKLRMQYLFHHNSSVLGKSYRKENGKVCVLNHALTSSNDRHAAGINMARVIADAEGKSICYTGRPDSEERAKEQIAMIFLHELNKGNFKGIDTKKIANGETLYLMPYVVNSMLKTTPLLGSPFDRIFSFHPERTFLENEKAALETLSKQIITVVDPATGRQYKVQPQPILVNQQVHFLQRFEGVLPPVFTGELRSREISQRGYAQIFTIASRKLKEAIPSEKKELIRTILNELKHPSHLPIEKEMFLRDLLCKEIDVPIVYHCKSSTDRTSISALSAALHQWRELGLPIPSKNPAAVLEDERFKELVAINLPAAHQVTRYSRGAKGTVNGEALRNDLLGLDYGKAPLSNAVMPQLLPDRYIKEYSFWDHVKTKISKLPLGKRTLLGIGLILGSPLIIAAAAVAFVALEVVGLLSTLFCPLAGRNWHLMWYPLLPITLLINLKNTFPKYVFNVDSPYVKERSLLKNKAVKAVD